MTNRPKAIGTAGESGLVKYLRTIWSFPDNRCRRVTLSGNYDLGDVHLEFPDGAEYAVEVKSGKMADAASLADLARWQGEAEVEARHANMTPLLVVKRRGVSPARMSDWRGFMSIMAPGADCEVWVELPLSHLLVYLASAHGAYSEREASHAA